MNASLSSKFRFGAESKRRFKFISPQVTVGKSQAALTMLVLKAIGAQIPIPVGPRDHSECPHRVTTDRLAPSDREALHQGIEAAYRQVLGNTRDGL